MADRPERDNRRGGRKGRKKVQTGKRFAHSALIR